MRLCGGGTGPDFALRMAAALAFVVTVISATTTAAQRPPENVRDGTNNAVPSGSAIDQTRAENSAAQTALFEAAVTQFESSQLSAAQRLFERVIALDPESTLAQMARRYLADLYPANPNVPHIQPPQIKSEAMPESPHPTLPWANAPKYARPAPADRNNTRTEPVRIRRTPPSAHRVSAALEEQFILEAGDRVFFGRGSAQLGGRAHAVIRAQARWLGKQPDLNATIEGYADDQPLLPEQQDTLSKERAEAVRQRLIAEGVEAQRLAIAAWGQARRVANCDDPACAAQNRRAITVLVRRDKGAWQRTPEPAEERARGPGSFDDSNW